MIHIDDIFSAPVLWSKCILYNDKKEIYDAEKEHQKSTPLAKQWEGGLYF